MGYQNWAIRASSIGPGNPETHNADEIAALIGSATTTALSQLSQTHTFASISMIMAQGSLADAAKSLASTWSGEAAEQTMNQLRDLHDAAVTLAKASEKFSAALNTASDNLYTYKNTLPAKRELPLGVLPSTQSPLEVAAEDRQAREHMARLNHALIASYNEIPGAVSINLPGVEGVPGVPGSTAPATGSGVGANGTGGIDTNGGGGLAGPTSIGGPQVNVPLGGEPAYSPGGPPSDTPILPDSSPTELQGTGPSIPPGAGGLVPLPNGNGSGAIQPHISGLGTGEALPSGGVPPGIPQSRVGSVPGIRSGATPVASLSARPGSEPVTSGRGISGIGSLGASPTGRVGSSGVLGQGGAGGRASPAENGTSRRMTGMSREGIIGRSPNGTGMMPMSGTGRSSNREQSRDTWLTEDEDLWNDDDVAVPPVIGHA